MRQIFEEYGELIIAIISGIIIVGLIGVIFLNKQLDVPNMFVVVKNTIMQVMGVT